MISNEQFRHIIKSVYRRILAFVIIMFILYVLSILLIEYVLSTTRGISPSFQPDAHSLQVVASDLGYSADNQIVLTSIWHDIFIDTKDTLILAYSTSLSLADFSEHINQTGALSPEADDKFARVGFPGFADLEGVDGDIADDRPEHFSLIESWREWKDPNSIRRDYVHGTKYFTNHQGTENSVQHLTWFRQTPQGCSADVSFYDLKGHAGDWRYAGRPLHAPNIVVINVNRLAGRSFDTNGKLPPCF